MQTTASPLMGLEFDQNATPIVATSPRGGLVITASLEKAKNPHFLSGQLSSEPSRKQREIIALLWFENPYADLSPPEAAKADAIEQPHCSNPG